MENEYLEDKFLFSYFKDKLSDVKFILRDKKKEKIKSILKDILKYEKELRKENGKLSRVIPAYLQNKIRKSQDLWEILIKEAIYCLRDKDPEDQNDFKQDFGIIEIKRYFKLFSDFEDMLYGSDKYYRDHSLHVIRVFLLGFYLLNRSDKINFSNIKIFHSEKLGDEEFSIEEKQAIWTLIALTHDLGYPLEKIDKINSKVKDLIKFFGPSDIEEFIILKFISSKLVQDERSNYLTIIQNKYYLKFAKAFENFKHGIMSCILLMKHLVYFKESDYSHSFINYLTKRDAKQFLIRKTILRSIASHDNDDIYHIAPNNFLFTLVFCDDLQEWDRPSDIYRISDYNKIKILKFNDNEISYAQYYDFSEDENFTRKIIDESARKIKRYIKLFRSGPDSEKRTFTFKFVVNVIKGDNQSKILTFEYPPRKKTPIVSILINNKNENENYIYAIIEYLEDNYNRNNENINEIIEKINKKFGSINNTSNHL
ncbi:MAG: hypothetical protein ACTSPW_21505 [Promethearchaeota archaeon]